MRILFISNDPEQEEVYRNFLSSIAERNSIYFVYSVDEGEAFLLNQTVVLQQQLDLILLCSNNPAIEAKEFRRNLIKDNGTVYSNRDFNLKEIPTILILDQDENPNFYSTMGFSQIIFDIGPDNLYQYKNALVDSIKSWRKKVLGEMDNLGIKFNSGKIDYHYYFTEKLGKSKYTNILSENFKTLPRKLNYDWLEYNRQQIEQSIDKYIKLLKQSMSFKAKQEELLYHEFFNDNQFFLKRDSYSEKLHEVKLDRNASEHYSLDFTLRPNFNYQTDLSLIEVKLPNEGILKKKGFHKSFLAKVYGHLAQVSDYKDYLEDPEYQAFVEKRFGFVPRRIDYQLLLGRSSERDENLDVIQKRLRQFNHEHVTLTTYDDLYDYQVKFLDRVNLLHIN